MKNVMKLGKALNKLEQKSVRGGNVSGCYSEPQADLDCIPGTWTFVEGAGCWTCLLAP